MSCFKCNRSYGNKPLKLTYGDRDELYCEKCIMKPRNGTCFLCKEIVKDTGNLVRNPETNEYNYFCSSQSCMSFVMMMKKPSNNDVPNCANCKKKENLKRCGGCKKVYYCSIECQKLDRQHHRQNCF